MAHTSILTAPATTAIPEPAAGDDLARGDAGEALLPICQARTGTGPWHAAHERVTAMTRAPVRVSPDRCGLYHGIGWEIMTGLKEIAGSDSAVVQRVLVDLDFTAFDT